MSKPPLVLEATSSSTTSCNLPSSCSSFEVISSGPRSFWSSTSSTCQPSISVTTHILDSSTSRLSLDLSHGLLSLSTGMALLPSMPIHWQLESWPTSPFGVFWSMGCSSSLRIRFVALFCTESRTTVDVLVPVEYSHLLSPSVTLLLSLLTSCRTIPWASN